VKNECSQCAVFEEWSSWRSINGDLGPIDKANLPSWVDYYVSTHLHSATHSSRLETRDTVLVTRGLKTETWGTESSSPDLKDDSRIQSRSRKVLRLGLGLKWFPDLVLLSRLGPGLKGSKETWSWAQDILRLGPGLKRLGLELKISWDLVLV